MIDQVFIQVVLVRDQRFVIKMISDVDQWFLNVLTNLSSLWKHTRTNTYKMCLTWTALTQAKSLGLPVSSWHLKLPHQNNPHDVWCRYKKAPNEKCQLTMIYSIYRLPLGALLRSYWLSWRNWNEALCWLSRAWFLQALGVSIETPIPHPCQLALKSYQHICLCVNVCVPFKVVQPAHLLRTTWLICCEGPIQIHPGLSEKHIIYPET